MAATARSVVVHGRVQGVFFRDSCLREAERLGVSGWVRNEPDGSVRVHVEGEPEAVASLVRWLHEGPPYARVLRVDVNEAGPTGATRFEVR
jgi:acylphosphatase